MRILDKIRIYRCPRYNIYTVYQTLTLLQNYHRNIGDYLRETMGRSREYLFPYVLEMNNIVIKH